MSNNVNEQVERNGNVITDVPESQKTIPDKKPIKQGQTLITEKGGEK